MPFFLSEKNFPRQAGTRESLMESLVFPQVVMTSCAARETPGVRATTVVTAPAVTARRLNIFCIR
ncbi:hypothetical protein GCM10009678_02290 [Actinomadura kijaniata]